jgi:putative ABC transport system permease protein
MIKNFLFVLRRFKTSAVLNIAGLSVAFAVFAITMMQVWYDFSYNRNFKNINDIYVFTNYWKNLDNTNSSISIPLAHKMVAEFPEIQSACILGYNGVWDFQRTDSEETSFDVLLYKADEGFLQVFTPNIRVGDARKAFTERNNVLITADVARRLFGDEDPVGKTLRQDTTTYTVVAVCDPFPDNCSIRNGLYTTILGARDYEQLTWLNYTGYFLVRPSDVPALQEKIDRPEFLEISAIDKAGLLPLTDAHFSRIGDMEGGGTSLSTILSFLAIGVLILLIAFINLMNFSVAMIPSRVREINIRKIMGGQGRQLRMRVASEAPCFVLVAFPIALFLIELFRKTNLKTFFSVDLSLTGHIGMLAALLGVSMGVGILFGLYPARRVTSFQPAMALSGSFAQSKRSMSLRNVLITIQFMAAIALICVAAFIQMQNRYMMDFSWGFQKENIVYLPVTSAKDTRIYIDEVKQNPAVVDCTITPSIPGQIEQHWGLKLDDRDVNFSAWIVQSNFLSFFGIPVIEGRDFILDDEGKNRFICNRAFLEKYEYMQAVGLKVTDTWGEFVGTMQDIHFESLHTAISPLCLVTQNVDFHYINGRHNYLFIKLAGESSTAATLQFLRERWETLSDKPFDLHFLSESMDELYQKESNMARLIGLFGSIIVIIAVMGIYGLIIFNARYKAREIAIRKVNGSSIGEIVLLLNRGALIQLAVAFVLAVPAAWFIAHRWVENFAYKIGLHWTVFLLGGLIVLLVTLLTVSAQSLRAAKTNPTQTLNIS